MSFDNIGPWVSLLLLVWNAAISAVLWLRKPGEVAARAVDTLRIEHDARLQAHSQRLTEMQAHMDHMPTSEELRVLEGTVKEVAQRTHGIADGMQTMRSTLNRIEDFLLKSR